MAGRARTRAGALSPAAYRIAVAARAAAAVPGGYLLAALVFVWLRAAVPLGGGDASRLAAMAAFLVFAAACIWAFSARRITSVLAGILLPAILLALIVRAMPGGQG